MKGYFKHVLCGKFGEVFCLDFDLEPSGSDVLQDIFGDQPWRVLLSDAAFGETKQLTRSQQKAGEGARSARTRPIFSRQNEPNTFGIPFFPQLFSGTLFPFFVGGCPTKNGLPQKGFPFFPRVTEQLSSFFKPTQGGGPSKRRPPGLPKMWKQGEQDAKGAEAGHLIFAVYKLVRPASSSTWTWLGGKLGVFGPIFTMPFSGEKRNWGSGLMF